MTLGLVKLFFGAALWFVFAEVAYKVQIVSGVPSWVIAIGTAIMVAGFIAHNKN